MDEKRVLRVCFLLVCASSLGKSQLPLRQIMPTPSDRMQLTNLSLADSIQHFALDLYQVTVDRAGHSANTVVSPFSVYTSLLMTSMGAKGSTLEQIERTLRLAIGDSSWKEKMTKLQKAIRLSSDTDVITEMANMMWISRGTKVKAAFFRSVADVFQTHVREANFNQAEPVRQLVNRRISNLTRGHIDQLLPPGSITKETQLLLANALYFKGLWLHPFNISDTFNEQFFIDSKKSVTVPMMHISDTFRASNLKEFDSKAIFLPYKNERHGLLCILPNGKFDLHETERRLFTSGFSPSKLLRKMIQRDVNLTLPKFKIRFDTEMSESLKRLGIVDLFSDRADLSDLSSAALTTGLKVSKVFHEATLEVNEGGSEAAAATAFEITPLMGGSWDDFGPIEFRADHPFIFYLIDRDNDQVPLFIGRLKNPLSNVDSAGVNKPLVTETKPDQSSTTKDGSSSEDIVSEVLEPLSASSQRIWSPKFQQNPIVFPDFDRFKRSDRKTENATAEAPTKSEATNETEVDTRVKDSQWFNKPTAPEVLIPIRPTNSDRNPVFAPPRPSIVKQDQIPTTSTPTTTTRSSDATISFNIFGSLPATPPPPPPPPGHPPALVPASNRPWGSSEPLSGGSIQYPSNVPFNNNPQPNPPFSIEWYQGQGNEHFPQSPQNTGIRFPSDPNFSLHNMERKKSPPFL